LFIFLKKPLNPEVFLSLILTNVSNWVDGKQLITKHFSEISRNSKININDFKTLRDLRIIGFYIS